MLPWYLDTFILKDLTESWHSRVNEVRPSFTILKHSCLSARIILHVGYVLWNFSTLSCTFLLSPHGGGATRCQCLSNQKAPSCETLVTRAVVLWSAHMAASSGGMHVNRSYMFILLSWELIWWTCWHIWTYREISGTASSILCVFTLVHVFLRLYFSAFVSGRIDTHPHHVDALMNEWMNECAAVRSGFTATRGSTQR